jgi:hypothetical protein
MKNTHAQRKTFLDTEFVVPTCSEASKNNVEPLF